MSTIPNWEEIRKMSYEGLSELIEQDLPRKDLAFAQLALVPHLVNRQLADKIPPVLSNSQAYWLEVEDNMRVGDCYRLWAWYYNMVNDPIQAIEQLKKGMVYAERSDSLVLRSNIADTLGTTFGSMKMHDAALKYHLQALDIISSTEGIDPGYVLSNISSSYLSLGQPEKALEYLQPVLKDELENPSPIMQIRPYLYCDLALVYLKLKDHRTGLEYALKGLQLATERELDAGIPLAHYYIGSAYYNTGQFENAEKHLLLAYELFQKYLSSEVLTMLSELLEMLADIYERSGNMDKAHRFLKEHMSFYKEIGKEDSLIHAQQLEFQLEAERQEKEFEKRLGEARLKTLAMLASEMAHEIQNPLQFVNNFSAINLELLDEQQEYLQSKDMEGIEEVRQDLLGNCEKIQEHGQRISKIVAELQDKTNKAQAGELELPTDNVHDFS